MLRAVLTFLGTNWPASDVAVLKADIRARIKDADPGGRSDATLEMYAGDAHLDQMIAWAREREQENRDRAKATAEQPVEPTFPDRGVTLVEAAQLADDALAAFASRVANGERPDLLLRVTVGAGKSEAAISAVPALLAAAKAAGRTGALYYAVPRHDLGDQLLARFRQRHPHLSVAIWRGMDQPDPEAPANDAERRMCADRELSRAATMAGQNATAACKACLFYPRAGMPGSAVCGYERQRLQTADVWLIPHNALFQSKPKGLPDAAVVVVDENFTGAAVKGQDIDWPTQLAVSALDDERTGPVTGADRERLLFLRRLARDALAMQAEDGGLRRDPFLAVGFAVQALGLTIPDTADEWADLEWQTKPKVKIGRDMDRDAALAVLNEAAEQGFTTLRPVLAQRVRDLLKGTDARSVNATRLHNAPLGRDQGTGDVVRFEWREDFAEWIAGAPKLFLDATTPAALLRVWAPDIEVVDIEVQAPHQHVRQIIGAEFGRTAFVNHPANVRRLADLVALEVAATAGGRAGDHAEGRQKTAGGRVAAPVRHHAHAADPGPSRRHHRHGRMARRGSAGCRRAASDEPATRRADGRAAARCRAGGGCRWRRSPLADRDRRHSARRWHWPCSPPAAPSRRTGGSGSVEHHRGRRDPGDRPVPWCAPHGRGAGRNHADGRTGVAADGGRGGALGRRAARSAAGGGGGGRD